MLLDFELEVQDLGAGAKIFKITQEGVKLVNIFWDSISDECRSYPDLQTVPWRMVSK